MLKRHQEITILKHRLPCSRDQVGASKCKGSWEQTRGWLATPEGSVRATTVATGSSSPVFPLEGFP